MYCNFRPVHLSRFLSDGLHVYTGSDDKTNNVYDITSETAVSSYSEFQVTYQTMHYREYRMIDAFYVYLLHYSHEFAFYM